MKAIAQARGALDALAALLPDSAERVTESGVEKVPLAELRLLLENRRTKDLARADPELPVVPSAISLDTIPTLN